MNLHDYVRICRRRWAWMLSSLLLAVIVAAAIYPFQPTTYASTTTVHVSAVSGADLSQAQQGTSLVGQRAATYANLAVTPSVLSPVIDQLRLPMRSSELAEDIEAEALPGTSLLEVTARAESAELAAEVADATVNSLQSLVDDIESSPDRADENGEAMIELSTVQAAEVPAAPQSPRLEVTLGIGLLVGLLLGLGLAFLREALDTTIRRPEDVAALTPAPLLGVSPREGVGKHGARGDARTPETVAAFREVRMRLRFGESFGSPISYVVTSSLQNEGRTTVATNLARSLAEGGRRTVLIGADFENPDLLAKLSSRERGEAQVLDPRQLPAPPGLREVLAGSAYLEDVTISSGHRGLDVVPPGAAQDQSLESSSMDRMQALLETCAESYDVTIVDSPSLLTVSDAAVLAQLTTGVIVVARYGVVSRAQLAAGFELLSRAHARVVGVILTGVPHRGPDSLPSSRAHASRTQPDDLDEDGQGHGPQTGPSSARPRRLPDGTLGLAHTAVSGSRSIALPQQGA